MALVLAGLLTPPAVAQEQQRSVLLILDGSKSMNDDAGDGRTRLDAAKAALGEVIKVLPEDAQVGLRVYGSKVSDVSRAEGCRDSALVTPVGPLDRDALSGSVEALQGKGRTPIGRSLLAAPGDLPKRGVRTVVLVSDGGDNCAPPDPCKAAAKVARGGVDLSISVVGLQVNARVRRQLECIADAGGGSYVDANDPDALRDELLAALARAFRSYEPTGTPVEGGAVPEQAPRIGEGQYLDALRPGEERFYAVELAPAQKLFTSVTAIPARGLDGSAAFRARLIAPDGEEGRDASDVLRDDRLGQYGSISTFGLRTPQVAAPWRHQRRQAGPVEDRRAARVRGPPGEPDPGRAGRPDARSQRSSRAGARAGRGGPVPDAGAERDGDGHAGQ